MLSSSLPPPPPTPVSHICHPRGGTEAQHFLFLSFVRMRGVGFSFPRGACVVMRGLFLGTQDESRARREKENPARRTYTGGCGRLKLPPD